jgi:preprotein translocase subunit YajC
VFLISDAVAQTTAAAGDTSSLLAGPLPMLVVMGLAMYFMIIRPQSKRAKELKALIDSLSKGDEVMTQSGLAGTVVEVRDNFVKLEIADKVEVLLQKSAVAAVLPKGTLKSV